MKSLRNRMLLPALAAAFAAPGWAQFQLLVTQGDTAFTATSGSSVQFTAPVGSSVAATVRAIRQRTPGVAVEVLVPDFGGSEQAVDVVLDARPNIFGHNVETVPRLYPAIRTGAEYRRSLQVLRHASVAAPDIPVKSGVMVGLGETDDEVLVVMDDLRAAGCVFLSIGQYLAPGLSKFPVVEYVAPERFERYRSEALARGFAFVASGPYVRSSYLADRYTAPAAACATGR